ncbi:MAG: hypothetical protein ACPG7U_04210, partial [Holosporaceae bacterium]
DALRQQGASKASLQYNIKTSLVDIEKHFGHKIVQDTQAHRNICVAQTTPPAATPRQRKRKAVEHKAEPVKKIKQEAGIPEPLKSHTTHSNPKNRKASAVKPQNNVKPTTPKKVLAELQAHDPSHHKLSEKKRHDAQGAVIEDENVLSLYVPKHLAQITKDPQQKERYLAQRQRYEELIKSNNI